MLPLICPGKNYFHREKDVCCWEERNEEIRAMKTSSFIPSNPLHSTAILTPHGYSNVLCSLSSHFSRKEIH